MSEEPRAVQLQIELPPEAEAGTYADFASIWHTPDVFVMDFVAGKQPPQVMTNRETGESARVLPAKVVSRVRIPPSQVFEIARALTQQLDAWEHEKGPPPPPSEEGFPGEQR